MDIYEDIFFIIPINLCLVLTGTAGSSERNIHFLISVNPSVVLQLTALRTPLMNLLFQYKKKNVSKSIPFRCISMHTPAKSPMLWY